MALADIIAKIEADAQGEAASIVQVAEERAAAISSQAADTAAAQRAVLVADAEEQAERDASRVVASARLAARDEGLARRRVLVAQALEAAADELATAGDTEYASFLARHVAEVARGGETLRLGRADAARAGAVVEALRMIAPGLALEVADEPAPFERGALIEGDRVRADLSLETIIAERRDELELAVATVLFGEGA